ncbi:PepSY-associated TM helix domain-containing protein [Flammeovirgaceae bacterium SG7u.111]|nr:PepSY-associated TM helix domain-containing protein [Flammeovirgaceae bacterium SG7u.132]WPO37092.1 PepSY-associated TM helix domain-containing protein [Flammeovirgaceae bacterium SG7u.111]
MNNKLLWKIHSWVGLYSGVIIAFLSLTGAVALFRDEIDLGINPYLRKVEISGEKVNMTEVVEREIAAHPDLALFEVELPKVENGTWNIRFFAKEKSRLFPIFWEVFVDPYTGDVLGERNYYTSFYYYLRNLHVRFYENFYGRQIVGLAGIALLISTITGFLIYGKFMKNRSFWSIRRKNLRMMQADLHKLIGITALAFNLVIAITGSWLGLQPYLQKWLDIERPNSYKVAEKPLDKASDLAYSFDYDAVLEATKASFPELVPTRIRPSTNGERTIKVLGDVPGKIQERFSNTLVFDKADFRQLFKYDISEGSFGGKLFYIQEPLHFGDFGGIWLKVFYCFFALTSGFLSLSGFIIYLKRTEKKRKEKPSFVELKPLLLRWSAGMLVFCAIVFALHAVWGIGIASLVVVVTFYSLLVGYLVKAGWLWGKKKLGREKALA